MGSADKRGPSCFCDWHAAVGEYAFRGRSSMGDASGLGPSRRAGKPMGRTSHGKIARRGHESARRGTGER